MRALEDSISELLKRKREQETKLSEAQYIEAHKKRYIG
jgi:hypothetical protein